MAVAAQTEEHLNLMVETIMDGIESRAKMGLFEARFTPYELHLIGDRTYKECCMGAIARAMNKYGYHVVYNSENMTISW